MRILYFADTRFPIERANGLQTMATCQALASRGHDVTLVVRADTHPVARDPFDFYGIDPVRGLAIVAVQAGGGRQVRRAQFLFHALAMARRQRQAIVYTRDLGLAALLLRPTLASGHPIVYESHGIAPVVSDEMPRLLGRPDLAPSRAKLWRLDRRERHVWTRAAAYVAITHALAGELADRYGTRASVFVVPDGARELPQSPGPRVAATGDVRMAPIAAYAGHLYPWKGVDIFVQALAMASDIRGLIVGGHPKEDDRTRVEQLAKDLGVSDRLEMTGLVPPADVARHLARASVLVLPNTASAISERYTSPLKLFEYLWMGRPIVASDLPSVREILKHEQTALLVPPGDARALANALNRLVADRTLADSLGSAARRLAPEFTWAMRAARLEPALEAAAAQS